MPDHLTAAEIEQLTKFRLEAEYKGSYFAVSMDAFLKDDSSAAQFLDRLAAHLELPSRRAAASIFMKRYAFLAVIYLYAMTSWDKKLQLSFDNLTLVADEADELWLAQFYLDNIKTEKTGANRDIWRQEAIHTLFADHLVPLMDRIMKSAKISKDILWENVAVYLFWLYETVFPEHGNAVIKEQARKDFNYILNEAPGDVFGGGHANPLTRYYTKPVYMEELAEKVRLRTSCCLSYLMKGKGKGCKTCPLYFTKSTR